MPPIFALEWVSLSMAGWLAAAAAPILIHLWSRRRHRETTWAAMEFLLAAVRQSRRRLLIEQWLLVAVRTLVIVLLVLAVMEPLVDPLGLAPTRGQRTHRLLVLDGSYSMDYRPTDRSRFERAKELAAKIVEACPAGDGFTLVLAATPPVAVVSTPALEHRDFLREIEQVPLAHTAADMPATMAEVERVLQNARRDNPHLVREEVYIISDLCRVGWQIEGRSTAATEYVERAKRLGKTARLVVFDVGQPEADNIAVTALESDGPLATPYRAANFRATLRSFSRQGHPDVPLAFSVDGRLVHRQRVSLPAGGDATANFSYRFDTPGDHVLEVAAEGDRLSVDNRRFAVMPVKEAIRVLIVDGRPGGGPTSAARYLARALSPETAELGTAGAKAAALTGASSVRVDGAAESAIAETPLAPYDCVFLSNVAQFTAGEAKILQSYTAAGGSLVFFLGDQVLPERYNRQLADPADPLHLLPARIGEVRGPVDGLNPLDYAHPIVRPFRGREKAGLLTTRVAKYYHLTLPSPTTAQVALAAGNTNDPLIVEQPVGRGRVFVVATAPEVAWTALPLWPSFVPLVHQMLSEVVASQVQQRNLAVGQPLGGSFPLALGEIPFTVRGPTGAAESLRARSEGDRTAWTYDGTRQSGVYTVQFGAPASQSRSFAVNVNTAESDLSKLSHTELLSDVWPGVKVAFQTSWEDAPTTPAADSARRGGLAQGLLGAALVLILLETYLARRMGRDAS